MPEIPLVMQVLIEEAREGLTDKDGAVVEQAVRELWYCRSLSELNAMNLALPDKFGLSRLVLAKEINDIEDQRSGGFTGICAAVWKKNTGLALARQAIQEDILVKSLSAVLMEQLTVNVVKFLDFLSEPAADEQNDQLAQQIIRQSLDKTVSVRCGLIALEQALLIFRENFPNDLPDGIRLNGLTAPGVKFDLTTIETKIIACLDLKPELARFRENSQGQAQILNLSYDNKSINFANNSGRGTFSHIRIYT